MRRGRFQSVVLAVAAFVSLGAAQESADVPLLTRRVTDLAGFLSAPEARLLDERLEAFEDSTSTQIAILTVPELGGFSIEEYSIRTFEKNRIGQKNKDNGVLLVIARQERRLRIEVGYGLEGVLTDALATQVIERTIKPAFREGRYGQGLLEAVDAIIAITAGEYTAEEQGPEIRNFFPLIFVVLFILLRLFGGGGRRGRLLGLPGWAYLGGWHSSGGTWGGGSFGGWSGGGGFGGGGGASGRW